MTNTTCYVHERKPLSAVNIQLVTNGRWWSVVRQIMPIHPHQFYIFNLQNNVIFEGRNGWINHVTRLVDVECAS